MTVLSSTTKNNIINFIQKKRFRKKKLLDLIKTEAYKNNPTERTILARYSTIKKLISEYITDPKFINKIKAPITLTNKIRNENKEIRDKKQLITINEDTIMKILSFRYSDNIYENAIYLLFVTGRRLIELLTAKFYSKKNSSNYIYIDGIRKRKDNKKSCRFIPLTDKKETIEKIHEFQEKIKKVKTDSFKRSLLRNIKKKVDDSFYTHMLRGIYIMYLYKFRNKNNKKINTFIMNNLCHQNIDSSLSYTGYNINFNEDIIL